MPFPTGFHDTETEKNGDFMRFGDSSKSLTVHSVL
jgi:hypothetical protein